MDLEIQLQSLILDIHFGSATSLKISDTKHSICLSEAWKWLSVTYKSPIHRLFADFKSVCFYFCVAAVNCI